MATKETVLARAKQGEPDAITLLMNRTLNQQNRQVRVLRQNAQLKLLVESAEAPPQAATVGWIEKGLAKLAIASIETAIVYGKAKQSAKPDWQQTITLASVAPAADPFSPVADSEAAPEAIEAEPALDLSEYCFTRNKSLLSGDLTLPSKSVIKLVLSFAALTNEQKLEALPPLDKVLRKPDFQLEASLSTEATSWLAQIAELEGPDVRKASIWMSRYCLDASGTVEQLEPPVSTEAAEATEAATIVDVIDATPVDSPNDPSVPGAKNQPFPSTHAHPQSPSVGAAASFSSGGQKQVLFSAGSRIPSWVIPTAWTLFLAIAIGLSIRSANAAYYGYPTCEKALGSPETCSLAVEIVGDEIELISALVKAKSLTPAMREDAIDRCSEYGYREVTSESTAYAARPKRAEAVTILASETEEVLPGVLVANVTQTDSNAAGITSRFACVGYAYEATSSAYVEDADRSQEVGNHVSYASIAADEIPMDWPEEPYSGLLDLLKSAERVDKVYNVFVNFGANTLFAAIGLFFAVLFCNSYSCQSIGALYQSAFAMGAFETVLLMLPVGGFRFQIAVISLGLGIASMFVKDFKIDWSDGYGSVAMGSSIVVFVRFILSLILYGIISQLVG